MYLFNLINTFTLLYHPQTSAVLNLNNLPLPFGAYL